MACGITSAATDAFYSYDTGYTITKVRSAQMDGRSFIVAASYEGTVIAMNFDGTMRWTNTLSGFMNRDLWCADITGDGNDEILAANADGSLYCVDCGSGDLLWGFKANDAPMNVVCVVHHENVPYVVCGGYDTNIYVLSFRGELLKTIASSAYSREKAWGKSGEKRIPESNKHIVNFIRTVRGLEGEEIIAVHGILNSNSTTGSIYLFRPMEDKPFRVISNLPGSKPYGDFSIFDVNADGVDEILLGSSTMVQDSIVAWIDLQDGISKKLELKELSRQIDGNGYRVAQTISIDTSGDKRLLIAFGSFLILSPTDFNREKMEYLTCGYSFNDMWKDPYTGKILLGSVQSGGSCIHVIDPDNEQWKEEFIGFRPIGKLKAILDNTANARALLDEYLPNKDQYPARPVYMMTESLSGEVEKMAAQLEAEYGSPVFLNNKFMPQVEVWDRSSVGSEVYRERRDERKKYTLSQQDALDQILPLYESDRQGVAFWGGHGNDPYMFSTDTLEKVTDRTNGKKSVFIYPELEQYDDDFVLVLKEHFYPMAEHFQGNDAHIYVCTKHAFWQSVVYLPLWSRLLSGEFADVFIPSMEETTDKTMEQSVAGRVGIWASGAVDAWGSRCARDNASFDRLRQHSHQMVPNHFLRAQIYNIALGANYQNNYPVDQQYFSILYDLIAKGVLFVPDRDEIVSISPVHLSMIEPDKRYLDEGNNAKWLTFYDEQYEKNNPMVFSRLNGTWPGAPVTEWDFSRFAAGVKDRRLNFLPPYNNGLVLITPPQNGIYTDNDVPRGKLTEHLHPIYKNIMQEYLTDGRYYYSADGKRRYAADEYYKVIERDIQDRVKLLPLTVEGEVAWVVAQTSSNHLRLTLIDSGYINPKDRTTTVSFSCG